MFDYDHLPGTLLCSSLTTYTVLDYYIPTMIDTGIVVTLVLQCYQMQAHVWVNVLAGANVGVLSGYMFEEHAHHFLAKGNMPSCQLICTSTPQLTDKRIFEHI